MSKATLLDKAVAWHRTLYQLRLPRVFNPIETPGPFMFWFSSMAVVILGLEWVQPFVRHGLGQPGPWSSVYVPAALLALSGFLEEVIFRGLAKGALGNFGLLLGSLVWVLLHPFYSTYKSLWRVPGDMVAAVFYVKLWRGRWWWLALVVHPLWNLGVVFGLQLLRIALL